MTIFWLGAFAIVTLFLTLLALVCACIGVQCARTRPRLIGAISGAVPGPVLATIGVILCLQKIHWPHGPPLGSLLASVFAAAGLVSMLAGGAWGAWFGGRGGPELDNRAICGNCGYDLRGLPDRRCPECGSPF